MREHRSKRFLVTTLALLFASACASPQQDSIDASRPTNHRPERAIEIIYSLGHSQHRFVIEPESKDPSFKARTYLDRELVDQASVDAPRATTFLDKAAQFMTVATADRREPASDAGCRSPFTVTFRNGKKTQVVTGCRATDGGALSRLVRDGEFLLYSKK